MQPRQFHSASQEARHSSRSGAATADRTPLDSVAAKNAVSTRSARCDLTGWRHDGHSFLTVSAVLTHASQKRCPQGVSTGEQIVSQQIGQRKEIEVAALAARDMPQVSLPPPPTPVAVAATRPAQKFFFYSPHLCRPDCCERELFLLNSFLNLCVCVCACVCECVRARVCVHLRAPWADAVCASNDRLSARP